jgi:hypothetical protein
MYHPYVNYNLSKMLTLNLMIASDWKISTKDVMEAWITHDSENRMLSDLA